MLHQLRARHHAAGMVHQIRQQPVFVRRELDRIAFHRHPAGARVEPYRSAIEFAPGVPRRAPQQRPDARQHFLEMERFGHVVVGSGIEPLDLVAPAVARREDQHRHGAAGAAPRFQYRQAVHLRQADVENDRIVGFGLAEVMAFLAVEGAIDDVTRVGQRACQLSIEIGIVLDHEETHHHPPVQRPSMKAPEVPSIVAKVTLPSCASTVST